MRATALLAPGIAPVPSAVGSAASSSSSLVLAKTAAMGHSYALTAVVAIGTADDPKLARQLGRSSDGLREAPKTSITERLIISSMAIGTLEALLEGGHDNAHHLCWDIPEDMLPPPPTRVVGETAQGAQKTLMVTDIDERRVAFSRYIRAFYSGQEGVQTADALFVAIYF